MIKIEDPVKGLNLSSIVKPSKSSESEFLTNGKFTVAKVEDYTPWHTKDKFTVLTLKPKQ